MNKLYVVGPFSLSLGSIDTLVNRHDTYLNNFFANGTLQEPAHLLYFDVLAPILPYQVKKGVVCWQVFEKFWLLHEECTVSDSLSIERRTDLIFLEYRMIC